MNIWISRHHFLGYEININVSNIILTICSFSHKDFEFTPVILSLGKKLIGENTDHFTCIQIQMKFWNNLLYST